MHRTQQAQRSVAVFTKADTIQTLLKSSDHRALTEDLQPMFSKSSTLCRRWFIWLSCMIPLTPVMANDALVSQNIDQFVEQGYREHKIQPNPPSSDEVFLRRIYLDVVGRIPTHDEATSFYAAEGPNKRSQLIQHLLSSEGHVSHFFNYWADVLRVKSDIRGEAGGAYAAWLKKVIGENRPYNKIVSELLTAQGYVWDNPAVGYFIRDSGMPLDNMSNTTQIFLGTQLVCAQCHNHPFDEWTQLDYYKMAAYTYGVETRIDPDSVVGLDKLEDRKKRRRSYEGMDRHLREAVNDILEPLSYGVHESERHLHLPEDYQYDDAAPGEEVRPDTIFGKRVASTRNMREAYADWMTSPSNDRFTRVIANRLWKKVMGAGLIEPVDDLKDGTEASNPELMAYLESQIVAFNYDMRRFLSVLYQTRTYQREATVVDVDPSDYHFPGPVLRRMTAEQLWDSMLTVAIPDVDKRKGTSQYLDRISEMKERATYLLALEPKEILDQAERIAAVEREFDMFASGLRSNLATARENGNSELAKTLSEQLREGEQKKREALKVVNEAIALQYKGAPMKTDPSMMKEKDSATPSKDEADSPWAGFPKDWVRASELESPAPAGHFLRQFGQSDRETIENASTEPSVDQVLTLLNGKIYDELISDNSLLMKAVEMLENDSDKQDYIFLTLLSRSPTNRERELLRESMKEKSSKDMAESLVWALFNTREFAFVQ